MSGRRMARGGRVSPPVVTIRATRPASVRSRAIARLRLFGGDGPGELSLGHLRPTPHVKPSGTIHELVLGRAIEIDAAERLAFASAGTTAPLPGARIRWALVLLGLPVGAHLLERVLERRDRGAVGALALAVRFDSAVVCLRPGLLGFLRRTPERPRHILRSRH